MKECLVSKSRIDPERCCAKRVAKAAGSALPAHPALRGTIPFPTRNRPQKPARKSPAGACAGAAGSAQPRAAETQRSTPHRRAPPQPGAGGRRVPLPAGREGRGALRDAGGAAPLRAVELEHHRPAQPPLRHSRVAPTARVRYRPLGGGGCRSHPHSRRYRHGAAPPGSLRSPRSRAPLPVGPLRMFFFLRF